MGQVWALPNGRAFLVAEIDNNGGVWVVVRDYLREEKLCEGAQVTRRYPAKLVPLPAKAAFLIADPCCPHLAPWSEPEVAP